MKAWKGVIKQTITYFSVNSDGIKKEFIESEKESVKKYGVRRKPIPMRVH
jgi:hypothetical protein